MKNNNIPIPRIGTTTPFLSNKWRGDNQPNEMVKNERRLK